MNAIIWNFNIQRSDDSTCEPSSCIATPHHLLLVVPLQHISLPLKLHQFVEHCLFLPLGGGPELLLLEGLGHTPSLCQILRVVVQHSKYWTI